MSMNPESVQFVLTTLGSFGERTLGEPIGLARRGAEVGMF